VNCTFGCLRRRRSRLWNIVIFAINRLSKSRNGTQDNNIFFRKEIRAEHSRSNRSAVEQTVMMSDVVRIENPFDFCRQSIPRESKRFINMITHMFATYTGQDYNVPVCIHTVHASATVWLSKKSLLILKK